MLVLNKSITLSGVSRINGQDVVYMSASLSTDGGAGSLNKNISNRELYNSNKEEVRKDMADFEDVVYLIEDDLSGGTLDESNQ